MKIIDLHCDTFGVLYHRKKTDLEYSLNNNYTMVSLEKMKYGDYMAQCFAMFVRLKENNNFQTCLEMIDLFYEEINKNKSIKLALDYDDIISNTSSGLMSAILTVEEGGVVEGKLENLRMLYRLGVRMICLTWNYYNGIGYPNVNMNSENKFSIPDTINGLTTFGIEMVREMNRLGIIVDVSHLSDKGFYDVAKISTKPIVASHSNSRTICNNVRNLTDDMIRIIANSGGVIGINFCPYFINESGIASIDDIINHIDYIKKIGGIDVISLGSDFDGISNDNLELKDASFMPKLINGLKKKGYTDLEINKIAHDNFLRVFKER